MRSPRTASAATSRNLWRRCSERFDRVGTEYIFHAMDDPRQPDMFRHTHAQSEMFDAPVSTERRPIHSAKYGIIEPPPPGGHTPETIRAKMLKLIAEARSSNVVPWPLRQ